MIQGIHTNVFYTDNQRCDGCRMKKPVKYTLRITEHRISRFCCTTCLFSATVSEMLTEGAGKAEMLAKITETEAREANT